MTPYLLFFLVSFFGLAYGTYTDFRERIVSNWLTYGMVAVGLGGHALWAFFSNDATIFAASVFATAAAFAGAYALYRAGVWAGGDVKLFAGIAALNPVNYAVLAGLSLFGFTGFGTISLPVFPLTLFIFSIFAMLPYGAFLAAARLARNRQEKRKLWAHFRISFLEALKFSALAAGFSAILSALSVNLLFVLPLLFIAAFLPKRAKHALAALMLFSALWLEGGKGAQQFFYLLALIAGLYLLFKLYTLSKTLMRKEIPIKELEEGMISAQTLVQRGKRVEAMPEMGIKKLINQFAANRFREVLKEIQPAGKVIVSSRSAAGLTGQEIARLKKLAAEKKIGKTLLIKESAPFVPAVLIAYLALSLVGDVIWIWLF